MATAFVTGALGGIGSSICRTLSRDGLIVVGLDLEAASRGVYDVHHLDVGGADAGERFADMLERREDAAVLVNCAALYRPSDVLGLDAVSFDRTFAVNVRGPFLLSQAFARCLRRRSRPGVVINVGSLAGRNGSVNVDYGASKGAVDALTKSLAKALAGQGIRVNAVAPGLIDTPMALLTPEESRRATDASPAGRRGTPDEVAEVVAFLASGRSGYVNGQSLAVCGGIA